jgi:hypothetical protein
LCRGTIDNFLGKNTGYSGLLSDFETGFETDFEKTDKGFEATRNRGKYPDVIR